MWSLFVLYLVCIFAGWLIATIVKKVCFCHQGEATWKMRSNGWFFDTLDEVEKFCAEMNG